MDAKFVKLIEFVLREADKKEENAAYSGERGDGGARLLRERVKFFKYGLEGTIPVEWKEYELQLDEEYEEYLRLKKKFEG